MRDKELSVLKGENLRLVAEHTLKVKKSEFICQIFRVEKVEEAINIIASARAENKSAKHVVYAYRVNGNEKYTDDGEPQNTAGKPIYDLLKKENCINVLVIVIRYFGGILLGSGPLMRTYLGVAKETLKRCEKEAYLEYIEKEVTCEYSEENKILNQIAKNNGKIKQITREEKIKIIYLLPKEE